MKSDPERERGILSTKDRQYFSQGAGIEAKSSAERVARARIRKRVYNAILDFKILIDEMEERDRKTVFSDLPDDGDLHQGIVSELEFIYLALKEQNLDFDEYLEEAVENAEKKIARKESDKRVEVDVDFTVQTNLVFEESRDISDYSDEEIGELLMNGEIDGEDAYYSLLERYGDTSDREIV